MPDYFADAKEAFTQKLTDFPAFEVNLTGFDHFTSRNGSILWVKPESDNLDLLQRTLMSVYPHCDDVRRGGVFRPHITVGRFSTKDGAQKKIAELGLDIFPISFMAKELQFFSKGEGERKYEIKETVQLKC